MIKTFEQFTAKYMTLYHGSSSREPFAEFNKDFITSGNGKTTFGYGFYFSDDIDVAKTYSNANILYTVKVPAGRFLSYEKIPESEKQSIARKFFAYYTNTEFGRDAYSTKEQKDACWEYECRPITESYSGLQVYNTVASVLGDEAEASAFMKSIGYTGLKYKDTESRRMSYTNYVIFDESDIKIVSTEKIS